MATKNTAVAKTANALPEFITHQEDFVLIARQALTARSSKAQFELAETTAKSELSKKATELRETEALKDNYIGVVRVVKPDADAEDLSPVRVEFKMSSKDSALKVDQMEALDEMFGGMRPQLWEKGKAITDIHDPQTLVKAIVDAGQNPWDYLHLVVKPGMDEIISRHPGVTAVEAILPKTGFLARLQEFGKNLGEEAKEYVRAYLNQALNTSVNIGSKGKA
jgi:hypothetical protein